MDFLVHHLLRTSASRFPEKEALVHGAERLSYESVASRTAGLARGLRESGVRRGDRIGIHLDPSVAQVLSIFGVLQAGGVIVPINSVLFPDQVAHIGRDCAMKALITTRSKLTSLEATIQELPSLEFLVVVGDDAPAKVGSLATYPFEELCLGAKIPENAESGIDRDLAALLYTSGSTGKPKGVMLNHANIVAGSTIVSTYLCISKSDRILAVLPFTFDAGLNQLITAFHQGGTIVLMTFTFAREIVQMLFTERITGLAGVPTLWSLLAQPASGLGKTELPFLRYVTNTGGAMPQAVLGELRRALPNTRIFLMYGLTEAFRSSYLPPEELDRRPTSMGKAIPNTELLIVNDDGLPCRAGEVGELVHRGPTVSMGYWGQPELTNRVIRPHPFLRPEVGKAEKVCYSGDLVKADEEGFLYFVGRRDAMIKSSGFRISPTEIEEVLFQTGKLREVGVIGVPDEVLGQALKAFVVPKEGHPVDSDTLIAFCAAKVPRYMVPKAVEIVENLPKTTNGKVDYPALRHREGL